MSLPCTACMHHLMKLPRSPARPAAITGALAISLLFPSLASAQPLTYQGQQGESVGSSIEEQMPPASDHPQKSGGKHAKLKPKASTALRVPPQQPVQSATEAANPPEPCAGRDGVLGTSRTIPIAAPNGLEVGLKTYPQTLKLEDHEVVLTFDDGPLPETTGKVLDALKAQCVKATFFLIGQNAAANPQLVRRQIREGHTVGHHTWSHPSITMRGLSDEAARMDIAKGIAADERAAYGEAARAPATPH